MKKIPKARLLARLKEKGVELLTGTKVVSIEAGTKIILKGKDGAEFSREAYNIVSAMGAILNNTLFKELQGKVETLTAIGDALEPGNIGSALRSAAGAAVRI